MDTRNARCELCWFAATGLGVGAYLIVLFAIDLTAGLTMSPERLGLIVLAGVALALMAVFVVLAIRMERHRSQGDLS